MRHQNRASGSSYSCGARLLSSGGWKIPSKTLACFLLWAILSGGPATACPAAIFIRDLPVFPGGVRDQLRLFVLKSGGNGRKSWDQAPLQLDPLSGEGRLVFPDQPHFGREPLARTDLLTLQAEDFGLPLGLGAPPLPCRSPAVYEIRSGATAAYLTSCPGAGERSAFGPRVAFDKEHHLLSSELYRYRFQPANYMQFASIAFRSPSGSWDEVATDSQLLIHADIKNFFTMQFDSEQIESHLEASRLGAIGNLARLSFFLRILIFKIQMSLATDVGFFADSGHIPMQVDLPINAYEHLNPGSGILYSWRLSPAARAGVPTMHMPLLDPALVAKGVKELAKVGLSYCQGDSCLFNYAVSVRGQLLSMDLEIRRDLVAKGFFPMFVPDVDGAADAMDWDVDESSAGKRIGMYFEVAGLPAGGHPWDFWLRLGAAGQAQSGCPKPVQVQLLK